MKTKKEPQSKSPRFLQNENPPLLTESAQHHIAHESEFLTQLKTYSAIANHAPIQRVEDADSGLHGPIKADEDSGLPTQLKSGIESLSGIAMDDVRVHYNSSQPAQLQAHAFAQGADIHLAPGQEKHLAHEAWHVVQQKQDRVKPTLQLKGVAINDDTALEQEADVMGMRAMGGISGNRVTQQRPIAPSAVQRKVTIEDKKESLDSQGLAALLNLDANPDVAFKKVMQECILPGWDSQNLSFPTLEEFQKAAQEVAPLVISARNIADMKDIRGLVAMQKNLQEHIAPRLDTKLFKGIFTTFGFEHEFADMAGDSPLSGVSHIELAATQEKMPLTGIPFFLETDASNALELVSPPFLVPTVEGIPFPDPDVIDAMDNLIKKRLLSRTPEDTRGKMKKFFGMGKDKLFVLMDGLKAALSAEIGWNFEWMQSLDVLAEHMSHRTEMAKLAKVIAPQDDPEDADAKVEHPQLSAVEIGKIKVGRSQKGARQDEAMPVTSQGNFATDIATASLIAFAPLARFKMGRFYYDLQAHLQSQLFPETAGLLKLTLFVQQTCNKLAGMFALHFQNDVVAKQQALYAELEKARSGKKAQKMNEEQERSFEVSAFMSSMVKDANAIWIKDHLASIAVGLLPDKEHHKLAFAAIGLATANLKGMKQMAGYPPDFLTGWGGMSKQECDKIWNDFIKLCEENLAVTAGFLKEPDEKISSDSPHQDLYHHDPKYVGIRQDTYLDPTKVSNPNLWNQRLHVVEIRRGKPADFLREGLEAYRQKKKQSL